MKWSYKHRAHTGMCWQAKGKYFEYYLRDHGKQPRYEPMFKQKGTWLWLTAGKRLDCKGAKKWCADVDELWATEGDYEFEVKERTTYDLSLIHI